MAETGANGGFSSAGAGEPPAQPIVPPNLAGVFLAFLHIGMMGFGGLAASAYHVLVEKRRWLEAREFLELFSVCTVLPGGNIINAAVVLGDRYRGVAGAFAGVAGLLLMPLAILMVLAMIYEASASIPVVRAGMAGAASAVAGLSIGTAAKMAKSLDRTIPVLLVVAGVFACVAIFRFSLPLVLLVAVPLSLAWAIWSDRRR